MAIVRLLPSLLLSLVLASCAARHTVSAHVERSARPDASSLTWLSKKPEGRNRYPVALYLDGSGCASVVRVMPYLHKLVDAGFGVAAPEKRGVAVGAEGTTCSDEYLDTNDRATRVADAELVLGELRARLAGHDGRVVLIGASEGASFVPEIAVRHADVIVAVVLLGGGGLDQATELETLARRRGGDPVEALERQFAAMEAEPTPTKSWSGADNTYKRWASYLRYRPLDFAVRIDAPIYAANGTRDESTPIESADALAAELRRLGKTNLTYRRWEGLDHRWRDAAGADRFQDVGADLLAWLRSTVP